MQVLFWESDSIAQLLISDCAELRAVCDVTNHFCHWHFLIMSWVPLGHIRDWDLSSLSLSSLM